MQFAIRMIIKDLVGFWLTCHLSQSSFESALFDHFLLGLCLSAIRLKHKAGTHKKCYKETEQFTKLLFIILSLPFLFFPPFLPPFCLPPLTLSMVHPLADEVCPDGVDLRGQGGENIFARKECYSHNKSKC